MPICCSARAPNRAASPWNSMPKRASSSSGSTSSSSGATRIISRTTSSLNWISMSRSRMVRPATLSLTQLCGRFGPRQDQVARLEIADVVADENLAAGLLDEVQFVFRVIVPLGEGIGMIVHDPSEGLPWLPDDQLEIGNGICAVPDRERRALRRRAIRLSSPPCAAERVNPSEGVPFRCPPDNAAPVSLRTDSALFFSGFPSVSFHSQAVPPGNIITPGSRD